MMRLAKTGFEVLRLLEHESAHMPLLTAAPQCDTVGAATHYEVGIAGGMLAHAPSAVRENARARPLRLLPDVGRSQ